MSVGFAGPAVAKRNDESTRVDSEVLRQARQVAAARNNSLAEYLSDMLRPIVAEHYRELAERMAEEVKQAKPKKR